MFPSPSLTAGAAQSSLHGTAAILDPGAEAVLDSGAASILDFRGSIWESLQVFAWKRPRNCSDSGFQGVNLGITARFCIETSSSVQ